MAGHASDRAARKAERSEKRAARRAAKDDSVCIQPPRTHLCLPPCLTPRQRALVHSAADDAGMQHESRGSGSSRMLHLGDFTLPEESVTADGQLPDSTLARFLYDKLGLQVDVGTDVDTHPPKQSADGENVSGRSAPYEVTLDEFISRSAENLRLEEAEEVARAEAELAALDPASVQARGRSLLLLKCSAVTSGLFGKTLLTLSRPAAPGQVDPPPLPTHTLTPHDIVALTPSPVGGDASEGSKCTGVVYRVRDAEIVVAVDDLGDTLPLDAPLKLDKLANKVTYERYGQVLESLRSGRAADMPGAPLLDIAFGQRRPEFMVSWPLAPQWRALSGASLDGSQRAAVALALSARDLALIHGPPGTGKTTALVEAVLQAAARGSRVLCAAASNVATDNLAERLVLANPRLRVVRVGHPARLGPAVLSCSLEAHVLRSDSSRLAADCRAEAASLAAQLLKLGAWQKAERRRLRAEMRTLGKEERARQSRAAAEVLSRAQVVCCTLTGVHSHCLQGQVFDIACLDEAAQGLEVAAWGALLRARCAWLAGDHLQLPPTVLSDRASRNGFSMTLFERLHARHGVEAAHMLNVQYRMHEAIMSWSSLALYGGRVRAASTVARHTLWDLAASAHSARAEDGKGKDDNACTVADMAVPLVLVDTAGCGLEEVEEEGGSRCNVGEAAVAVAVVQEHILLGVNEKDIGVITPYSAQRTRIRDLSRSRGVGGIEVSTVDGFQGREKEVVIISMVRSNAEGDVGFLADKRRMNVAVTRARRRCVLVCDSETVSRDTFLATLLAHFEANGSYRSAGQYETQ